MIDEIEKIIDSINLFFQKGHLNKVWFFIKDIRDYELQIYLEPFFHSNEEVDDYLLHYNFEEGYGTLIGRLNYQGYFDFNDNLRKIPIDDQSHFKVMDSKANKKYIFDAYSWNFLDFQKKEVPLLTINSFDFFYKINESVFLILIEILLEEKKIVKKKKGGLQPNPYKNIDFIQRFLFSKKYDCYITFVGKWKFSGFSYRENIVGFDCDEVDPLIKSPYFLFPNSFLEEIQIILETEENQNSIEETLNYFNKEISLYLEKRGIDYKDNLTIFTNIEHEFKEIFAQYYDIFKEIVDNLRKPGKNILNVIDKIKKFGRRYEPKGFYGIYAIISEMVIPYFDEKGFEINYLNELKKLTPWLNFGRQIRNHLVHNKNISIDKKYRLLGVFFFINYFKAYDILKNLLERYKNQIFKDFGNYTSTRNCF